MIDVEIETRFAELESRVDELAKTMLRTQARVLVIEDRLREGLVLIHSAFLPFVSQLKLEQARR